MSYLTVGELLEVLSRFRISRRTIYEWIESGRIESIRPTRRILVPAGAVERLVGELEG